MASWHSCLARVVQRLVLGGLPAPVTRSPWVAAVCGACAPVLRVALHSDSVELGDAAHVLTQRTITAGVAESSREALLTSLAATPDARAAFRSAGGPGAAAWMRLPTRPAHHLTDKQFSLAAHFRMHLDVPGCCGTCQHRAKNGTLCGAVLDRKGVHARSCPVGGWRMRKHDSCCGVLNNWLEEMGCYVEVEVVLPPASNDLDEPRMDLIVHAPGIKGPVRIDFTAVSALSREALRRGSADREEVTANLGAARKRQKYANIAVTPFVLEESGRMGADALGLVRKIAPRELGPRAEALNDLYQGLAATLQRASANSAIAAMGGRPPPSGGGAGGASGQPGPPMPHSHMVEAT